MQFLRVACFGLLAFVALVPPCGSTAVVVADGGNLSPITRVVQLLKDLSSQIEKDGKEEEDLYETFVCWAKSIISQKTESNTAAQARVDTLQAYIDDLDAGRIELTTERVDLTKEIEEVSGDMEVAKQNREQEEKDYEEAKDEMEKAIEALTDAIAVLRTATKNHTTGVLLDIDASIASSYAARAKEAAALSHAAELGEKVLTSGDAFFLRRLLTGEVPTWDWKKLNRKATFKADYRARSFKIQDVLAKMLGTFEENLKEANTKEADAIKLYDELMDVKGQQKGAAQAALASMEKETGARGQSREESVEEKGDLLGQITNDEKYISQVEAELENKKTEWKDRKALRQEEAAAVSKAISILHSDDARDLFKKSLTSQGYLFLQEGISTSSNAVLASRAAETLRIAANKAHAPRLSALALRLSALSGSHFTEVIKAIDDMVLALQDEESEDLQKKEQCEANRATDTREAIKTARSMDELSDEIFADKAKIKEITAEIQGMEKEVEAIIAELKEAKDIRDKEHAEYRVAKKDDQDAAVVVKNAKEVLEQFYSENGLMLVQQRGHGRQPFVSEAGKAPPPPPATWEAPYGGKTDESTGIIALLETVHADILKDIQKADADENEAADMYGKTKSALETEQQELNSAIQGLEEARGDKINNVVDNSGDRRTQKGELAVVLKRIADSEPGCDWFGINYPLRLKNRQIEIDGLKKAKAILSGGKFSLVAVADTSRMAHVRGHLRASQRHRSLA